MGYGEIGAEGLDTGMDLSPSLRAKTRCEIQDGRARKGGVNRPGLGLHRFFTSLAAVSCVQNDSGKRIAFHMLRMCRRDCLSQLVNSALIGPLKPTEGLNGASGR